jgi:hypothetical protein
MSDEKIEVGYRNIGTMGGVDYHHKFLLYTDSAGNQHTISGWTDDANNPDSPLRHPDQLQHRETIAEGADSLAQLASIDQREQSNAPSQAAPQFAEARTPEARAMTI